MKEGYIFLGQQLPHRVGARLGRIAVVVDLAQSIVNAGAVILGRDDATELVQSLVDSGNANGNRVYLIGSTAVQYTRYTALDLSAAGLSAMDTHAASWKIGLAGSALLEWVFRQI